MKRTCMLSLMGIVGFLSSVSAQVRTEFLLEKGYKSPTFVTQVRKSVSALCIFSIYSRRYAYLVVENLRNLRQSIQGLV